MSASASWYLYKRNHTYDRWNASFITCFSTIQLLEASIWASDPSKNSKSALNEFLTKMIVVGLTAQPLVQAVGGFVVTRAEILWYLSWVLIGFFLYSVLRVTTAGPGKSYSTIGPNGHLQWHSPFGGNDGIFPKGYGILYAIGLFVPLLFMKAGAGLVLLAVGIGTAIYSLTRAKGKEFGSMWCFTAVLYSLAAILVG